MGGDGSTAMWVQLIPLFWTLTYDESGKFYMYLLQLKNVPQIYLKSQEST